MSNFSLTDEEMKKNWDEYGNPDGPGGLHLVICSWTLLGKVVDHFQILLPILSELISITTESIRKLGFVMISGEIEVN